jgi:Family of unknown function (DUF6502)
MTAVESRAAKKPQRPPAAPLSGTFLLQELLTELAFVLLPRGITPRRFNELARYAFVRAATKMSRFRNGRVNYSRVAAQTGLSRADVKRLLASDVLDTSRSAHAPTERVIDGWRTDRLFADRFGRPRRLRITGPRTSFASLVKKYGGDVTHRAVLEELRRTGGVKDNGQTVWLRASPSLRRRSSLAVLSPVLPVLVDGIRLASRRSGSSSSSVQRLTLPVGSQVDLAIVRERCSASARTMLDGLSQSLGTDVTVPRTRRSLECSFTISVLLVDNSASNEPRHVPIARAATARAD